MKFSLRRLIITIICVLILAATTSIYVFVSSFDLNSFRIQISDNLSSRISQPVHLGEAHFSLKHGPSFAFSDIRIGTKNGRVNLNAEQVFFRLEVLPLLLGNYRFSEILLERPDITARIGGSKNEETKGGKRLFIDQSLLKGDLVRAIRIHNGHFRIEDFRQGSKPFVIALEDTDLLVDDLSLRRSGWLEIKTTINCNNIRSPFKLNGLIRAGNDAPFWQHASYDIEMQLTDFASDVLTNRYPKLFSRYRVAGRTDLRLQLSGKPATGLRFNVSLAGRDLGITLPNHNKPLSARTISTAGLWTYNDRHHILDDLKLQFGPLEATAALDLDLGRDIPSIKASVQAPELLLTDLNPLLDIGSDEASTGRPTLTGGTMRIHRIELQGPISDLKRPELALMVKKLDIDILNGRLLHGEQETIDDINLALDWQNNKLTFRNFGFTRKGISLGGNGTLAILPETADRSPLTLSGNWQLTLNDRRTNNGQQKKLFPQQGLKAELAINGSYADERWLFSDNLLTLPALKVLFDGSWSRRGDRAYTLKASIPDFPLDKLSGVSPAVSTLRPDGSISANIHLRGSTSTPFSLSGNLDLKQAALHIAGPLADLSKLDGSIELNWPQLHGEGLAAQLGTSPITLALTIPDLKKPEVNMAINGDSIRADELIFRSEKTYLRDVDAKLSIRGNELLLGPIRTRMDGGTDVTINGVVNNFPTPDTYLSITGAYGNIDEVISLWSSDKPRGAVNKKKKKRGKLEIDIATDGGEIANLPFEKCTGHISYRNRTLIIHPIQFQSGSGTGLGQVLVVYRDNQPPLLKMSARLQNFDALAIYQQLLRRKGIVTGKLDGDFYLEGTAGNLKETFLPSSYGAFNFTIKDGILKKLQGLSKTLTLFNIYPLFTSTGDENGVPFKKLTGDIRMENGVLQSGNMLLKGDVMNMSMTGHYDLVANRVNLELGIMPLRSIDRVITKIPLAGWLLAGEDKALITAHFKLIGAANDPEVKAIPIQSASKQVVGIFERLFTLPVKIITDIGKAID